MTKFAAGRVQARRPTTPALQSRPDLAEPASTASPVCSTPSHGMNSELVTYKHATRAATETGRLVRIQPGPKPDRDTRPATALRGSSEGTGDREKAIAADGTNLAQIIRANFCFSDSGRAWRT